MRKPKQKTTCNCGSGKPHTAKGLCSECYYRKQYLDNKEDHNRRALKWHKDNPESSLLCTARFRSKKGGLAFSLTAKDITIPESCPVLGIKLRKGVGKFCDASPSIDRLDPSKGYTPDNVLVISYRANRIKCDANLSEILLVADYMLKNSQIGTVS